MPKSIEEKPNRIHDILTKDYKWESGLLLFLSIVILAMAGLLVAQTLVIDTTVPVIGKILGTYPIVTEIVLFVLGFVGLFVSVWPVVKPSVKEVNKLTFPTKSEYGLNIARVFSFIIGLLVIFMIYDLVIVKVFAILA